MTGSLDEFTSVKESLPQEGQNVIAYNPFTGPFEAQYKSHTWESQNWNGIPGTWYPTATHWKPR